MQSTIKILRFALFALCALSITDAFSCRSVPVHHPAAVVAPHRIPSMALYNQNEEGEEVAATDEPPKPAVKCPNCDKCDGSGRILGGIAVILPWWPIKAYRPCPNFIASGGFYERSGQGLDEIAFGRDSTYEK